MDRAGEKFRLLLQSSLAAESVDRLRMHLYVRCRVFALLAVGSLISHCVCRSYYQGSRYSTAVEDSGKGAGEIVRSDADRSADYLFDAHRVVDQTGKCGVRETRP